MPLLAYDGAAARIHADIRTARERIGMPLPFADGQIAAIALAQRLTVVTRNTADFKPFGVALRNPFVAAR